jgi:hypothetical protein
MTQSHLTIVVNDSMSRTGRKMQVGKEVERDSLTHRLPVHLLSRVLSALLISALASSALSNQGQPAAPSEYQVKAAFLYNFAKFIEWPVEAFKSENPSLIVGIVGADPFGSALEQTLAGKSANGRALTIRRLKWGQSLRDCHILFISASERKRLAQILESLRGASVLTVSELENFHQQGGITTFILEENKVRFAINTEAAEQARLKISSKLLILAKPVNGERQKGRN